MFLVALQDFKLAASTLSIVSERSSCLLLIENGGCYDALTTSSTAYILISGNSAGIRVLLQKGSYQGTSTGT